MSSDTYQQLLARLTELEDMLLGQQATADRPIYGRGNLPVVAPIAFFVAKGRSGGGQRFLH